MKNKKINYAIPLLILISVLTSCNPSPNNSKESVFAEAPFYDADNLKHIKQEMVSPPALPKHEQVAEGDPVVVEVTFFVEEKKIEIATGVKTWALTFNGTVPGPMIVVLSLIHI